MAGHIKVTEVTALATNDSSPTPMVGEYLQWCAGLEPMRLAITDDSTKQHSALDELFTCSSGYNALRHNLVYACSTSTLPCADR